MSNRCKAITKFNNRRCLFMAKDGEFCKTHAPKSNGEDVRAGYAMGFEAGVASVKGNDQPVECRGCRKELKPENAWMTDGCPCNSPCGVNDAQPDECIETLKRLLEDERAIRRSLDQNIESMQQTNAVLVKRLSEREPTQPDELSEEPEVIAMERYLRVCRSGGMTKAASDKVLGAVKDAARLNYFKVVQSQLSPKRESGDLEIYKETARKEILRCRHHYREEQRMRGVLNEIVYECLRPESFFLGGDTQRVAKIQAAAEAGLKINEIEGDKA